MLWVGLETCANSDVPASDAWLSSEELSQLAGLEVAKRRADFRLGRWTARRALAAVLGPDSGADPPQFLIRAAEDGAPEAFFRSQEPVPWVLSISHSHGLAVAAVAARGQSGETRLGCDVERIEPRSDELVEQFFTQSEQAKLRVVHDGQQALVATLIWSAKESALKATRTGLRADTRSVEVDWEDVPLSETFVPLRAAVGDLQLEGHAAVVTIGTAGRWVLTLLSQPGCDVPARLGA
jgi:4'-phosphopantetheinyl transferase